MVDGVPHVKWMEEKVDRTNRIENLQYAVVGKLTYDWSDLEELRKSIPQQCGIKWDCQIDLFRSNTFLFALNNRRISLI